MGLQNTSIALGPRTIKYCTLAPPRPQRRHSQKGSYLQLLCILLIWPLTMGATGFTTYIAVIYSSIINKVHS